MVCFHRKVEEILDQRRRKGALQYLVRWKGFNELYDSWEPSEALSHCANAIKAFVDSKKKSTKSRSRSRSRGRSSRQSKSKSRSRSRGRQTSSRSRSRSASRKTQAATKVTRGKSSSEVKVAKSESSEVKVAKSEAKASRSRVEIVSQKTSAKESEGVVEKKSEVVTKKIETVQTTPVRPQTATMTTRSRLAVKQVQNDEQPVTKKLTQANENETWMWWFADHAVLALFIIVSIIALSFTVESLSEVREKLVPDFTVLQHRLGESYSHLAEAMSGIFSSGGDNPAAKEPPAAKSSM